MVYFIVTALTIVSAIVVILLFDSRLLQTLTYWGGAGFKGINKQLGRMRNMSWSGQYRPIFKRGGSFSWGRHYLKTRQWPSMVYVLSALIIISTASLCFWLINYSALDVYHKTEQAGTPYNTQINQLLLGERLSPPPAPPDELFAELDAEIASYQATQVEKGYWPEQNQNPTAAVFPSTGTGVGSGTSGSATTNVVVPMGNGNSRSNLDAHLTNGYINIRNADRNWNKMNSEFVQRLLTVYKIMKDEHGYDMVLLEGYRSPARQARLLSKGAHVTKAGAYRSYHQFGLAADSAFIRNGKIVISERDPWAMRGYTLYGQVAKSVGLVWGGDWRMKDLGHVELRKKNILGKPEMAKILTNQ